MIIYVEKQVADSSITQSFLSQNSRAQIVYIDHYKNVFDLTFSGVLKEKIYILARLTGSPLLPVPKEYGYIGKSYFLRSTLNCVFDCQYCFLKGAFKNSFPVIFVNYDEILSKVKKQLDEDFTQFSEIYLYPSNFADVQGIDSLAQFSENFFPFFAQYPGLHIESRTKSTSIEHLLEYKVIDQLEIAYSLNPQIIVDAFERGTPQITKRIDAMQKLIEYGRKVGVRFMPLIPVDNWQEIYGNFLDEFCSKIDIKKLSSIHVGALLFTKNDYSVMRKKDSSFSFEQYVEEDGGLMRVNKEVRISMYELFEKKLGKVTLSFED